MRPGSLDAAVDESFESRTSFGSRTAAGCSTACGPGCPGPPQDLDRR
ncbi:hypothetical protein ACGF0J_26570 [Nonomuraea sp. NPDC047897]